MRQEVPLSQGDRRALYRCGSCFHIPNLMYLMNDYHVFKVHAAIKLQSFLKGEKGPSTIVGTKTGFVAYIFLNYSQIVYKFKGITRLFKKTVLQKAFQLLFDLAPPPADGYSRYVQFFCRFSLRVSHHQQAKLPVLRLELMNCFIERVNQFPFQCEQLRHLRIIRQGILIHQAIQLI